MNKQQELEDILNTMDIPHFRKKDIGWLMRNIQINNNEHPDIDRALSLIKDISKENQNGRQ